MSDEIEKLSKEYGENVLNEEHPRSIGLFPIPEYPELEGRGMWSTALDAILTTLRYLAPATLLTIFWGQQSFLFKLLKHIDSAFRAIVFSSEEQKQSVLRWLAEAGPIRVEHLDTVWRHGWILCGVLDAALPGACAGHPPTRLSLKHAQAIADHYLGVDPVFTRQELESNDSLSKHQEWKLATFLDRIRQALAKLTPPVSKPTSQRTSPETTQFTLDYIARGSGLSAAQVHNKVYFKIYPTTQQSLDPGEITILIRGPKDTYGMSIIPPILGKPQKIRQNLLGLQPKVNYTENVLPITQGATYLRSFGRNDMNKTYYIPKTKYDIEIESESKSDYTRVGYIVHNEGKYELSITSRGQSIVGSPFTVTASKNILGILERKSFSLEDGEEIDIVDVQTDRKVVLRIVDFVTEKMLLRENGSLEKISDDEAKLLMENDSKHDFIQHTDSSQTLKPHTATDTEESDDISNVIKSRKFYITVNKIKTMNKVSKIFNDLLYEKNSAAEKKEQTIRCRPQKDIPDIVNSTFADCNINAYMIPEKRDRVIIPESISVSLLTEKAKPLDDYHIKTLKKDVYSPPNTELVFTSSESPDKYKMGQDLFEEDNMSTDTAQSSNNPFLCDMYTEDYITEKKLGSFLTSEYETNNSHNEETDHTVKILVENASAEVSPIGNPFMDYDIVNLERPKTPVLKIISGDTQHRNDSLYVDAKAEEILSNEFINPFFAHHHQSSPFLDNVPTTDFIIGAPVSLPPIVLRSSPETRIESMLINANKSKKFRSLDNNNLLKNQSHSEFSTLTLTRTDMSASPVNSKFHSLDSNLTENTEDIPFLSSNDDQAETFHRDMWDSAYVSIDDSNSSPDSNNNDSSLNDSLSKQKFSSSDVISNMGPAEREIWQTCHDLKDNTVRGYEEVRPNRWDIKRPTFTPIIEESDRSLSSGMKEIKMETSLKHTETDPVTMAFAELNNIYDDYFPSENSSITTLNEVSKQNLEIEYTTERNDVHVDSASELLSDVMRHASAVEGTISEVQANVTESVSASQNLHDEEDNDNKAIQNKTETQFGDNTYSNIVSERKKYWDEKIRQIQAKSEETKTLQKKKRLCLKYGKNDSLSKKRGKQTVKNFLNAGGEYQKYSKSADVKNTPLIIHDTITPPPSPEETQSDIKLVEKWKNYWDHKLEAEKEEFDSLSLRSKSPKSAEKPVTLQINKSDHDEIISPALEKETISQNSSLYNKEKTTSPLPTKQELPEEVFKAFETSPRRFFGTSRKQILNKIDNFLGKPIMEDSSSSDEGGVSQESGLVSSRISLFHSISRTEELPWTRRKCQSMQNIYQRKDSISTEDENIKVYNKIHESEETQQNINATEANNVVLIQQSSDDSDKLFSNKVSLKEKRARIAQKLYNLSFDEDIDNETVQRKNYVKHTIRGYNEQSQSHSKYIPSKPKMLTSKSEMDIFSKITNTPPDDSLDKYKSCEELPKINVKNVISLYEDVSKLSSESNPMRRTRTESVGSRKHVEIASTISGTASINTLCSETAMETPTSDTHIEPNTNPRHSSLSKYKSFDSVSSESTEAKTKSSSIDIEIVSNQDKEVNYLSLSDIDLEIVESSPNKSIESTPERDTDAYEYKNRFKMAKQYFQSLEELREPKKTKKMNECELLLQNNSESPVQDERQPKRVKKNIKAHSLPTSEISKTWNEFQETQNNCATKLVKISEKFNVEDLFTDVMEGRLSRQGSLRGIPHKKAVLETFKSMENVSDKQSSYELAVSQLNDFAKENKIKNAQTYLSEYPYLPTTDPSKYHSRIDATASGLISYNDVLKQKPRRNSVPDLLLNPTFTADL